MTTWWDTLIKDGIIKIEKCAWCCEDKPRLIDTGLNKVCEECIKDTEFTDED
jgi:hypothetical protein